jgi:ATP-binding cassette, subfamily B, beta-glucan exporter
MHFVRLYARVLQQLGQDKRVAGWLSFANVLLVLALFAEPILFGRIIDTLTRASSMPPAELWTALWPYIAAWIFFGLFTIVCGTTIALLADRLAHKRRHVVLRNYFEHILQLPAHQRHGKHSGRLMKIMLQGSEAMWGLWLGFFRDHLSAFVSIIVLIPIALYMNWQLASLLIVLCVIFVVVTNQVLKKTHSMQGAVEAHHSDLAEHVSDTLGNVALVQSFARVRHEVETLKGLSDRVVRAQFPVLSWWAVVTVLVRSATTLTVLSILLLGLWLFTQNLITVGEIVTFIVFASMIIVRLEQAVSFTNRLAMEAPRLVEFFDVLDTLPQVRDLPQAQAPGRLQGRIEFKNVAFSYDGQTTAVKRLNFVVEPGQTVALVGASGAGKSTALALLHRVFDPDEGQVLIDDQDIKTMTLEGLRQNIGVVFQEALLFNRSISDNLRVGKPDATLDELTQAAKQAQALEFIERQHEGFNARIGERGRALSGGERQRLSVARVLLKDPPILILDEATSALDADTEVRVQAALEAASKNRTTLVIAHRLSTVRHADFVLVFDGGQIVESGSFSELAQAGGIFAKLVSHQFGLTTK